MPLLPIPPLPEFVAAPNGRIAAARPSPHPGDGADSAERADGAGGRDLVDGVDPARAGDSESGTSSGSGESPPASERAPTSSESIRTSSAVLAHGPEASLLSMSLATIFMASADPGDLDARDLERMEPMHASPPLSSSRASTAPERLAGAAGANGADAPDAHAARAESALRAESAGARLVERGLQALLQQRGGTLVMRLSPPELGVLEIRMSFDAGRVAVHFRPSSDAARQLLDGNLGMLRQSLERHGVGVGRLVVEPPAVDRAEELARSGTGHTFDAGGRESMGRQEAERELRWRTDGGLRFAAPRPDGIADDAAEGRPTCPSSTPPPPRRVFSRAASPS